jgi:hypothetical protein
MPAAAGLAPPLGELGVAGVAGALAGALDEELVLLLPPQPASNAAPLSATTHNVHSLALILPP